MSNGVTFSFFYWCHTLSENLILISNPLIVKGDEEFGKERDFSSPSFSDPLGARTQDPNIKKVLCSTC